MTDVMRKTTSLLLFSFFFIPCLTNGKATLAATISSGIGPWCVASREATVDQLQANIQYACGGGIANCDAIQVGGLCYSIDIVLQASYAMNAYFYVVGGAPYINCYFNGTGLIVLDDPSYDRCNYPS